MDVRLLHEDALGLQRLAEAARAARGRVELDPRPEARAADLARVCTGREEVEAAIDRVVWYAGWADKLPQVLGGSNPVAGPYFDFTVPEPTGVVAVLAPDEPPLGGLVSRVVPALVGGNTVVAVASAVMSTRNCSIAISPRWVVPLRTSPSRTSSPKAIDAAHAT